jgi:hypothetical protein
MADRSCVLTVKALEERSASKAVPIAGCVFSAPFRPFEMVPDAKLSRGVSPAAAEMEMAGA